MLAANEKDTATRKPAHARASIGTTTTAESTALDGSRSSQHSKSVAESVVSKEEMFEMLKEAHPDDLSVSQHSVRSKTSTSRSKNLILAPAAPKLPKTHEDLDTDDFKFQEEGDWWDSSQPPSGVATNVNVPIKQKNMLPKVQGKISGAGTASSVAPSLDGESTVSKRIKKKRIKMRAGDGSVCSSTGGSVDPRLLEAMKSGKRMSAKELEQLGVKVAPRGRPKKSSEDKKSRARSKSRGRPRGDDGEARSRARSKSRGRPRGDGEARSRARSKSRGRPRGDDEGRSRARSKSRPRGHDDAKSRGRSKSRPRAGRDPDENRSRARSKCASRARSKSRPRAKREEYDDSEDAGPIKVGMVISVETEAAAEKPSRKHEEEAPSSPSKNSFGEKCMSPLRKMKQMLSPKKNKDGKSVGRGRDHGPSSPTKSRSRRKEHGEYDDDDESASLPPIPMQIVVDSDDLEKVDTVEEQPQISGNSDEMYLKMKEAGITPQQFRALAEAGLTIAEG